MESAPASAGYVAERLDQLGIVAGVCRKIGLAEWLDEQDTQSHERVSVGTATVAMVLNGLGFSNRRLYLAPQFFATKGVERLFWRRPARVMCRCFCPTLDGNASDKVSLVAAVDALAQQLRAAAAEADDVSRFVADSGLYKAENVERLSAADVRWISRTPETSEQARSALQVADDAWQQEGDLF